MDAAALASDIHAFWFGAPPHAARAEWFRKDPAFDARIRTRFGPAIDAALAGEFREWSATPRGALARILLLDQFTRNVFRDTPRAFAGDPLALELAGAAVDAGFDRELDRFERAFLYLPFEHSEDPSDQERSLELFGRLAAETGDRSPLEWAEKHAVIVRRFGRFPHRNAILGRASTPEEVAFLQQPGSGF
ncbi:MAG: DUF924 domain-containing protein [Burkholderiales bacterium]|nr:DUF924 domain-containing protein [Burkholderiales bacterium]